MTDEQLLLEWMERIKQGDGAAAEDLVRAYEPELRRFVRYRLATARMRSFLDSLDVTQSVFARFFCGVAEGKLDVAHPKQLFKLLYTMAGNRVRDHVRRAAADKRAHQRAAGDAQELMAAVADGRANPDSIVADAELVDLFRARLSADEQTLLDARMAGRGWQEIAEQAAAEGEPQTPEGLRKRLARAIDRAAGELDLPLP